MPLLTPIDPAKCLPYELGVVTRIVLGVPAGFTRADNRRVVIDGQLYCMRSIKLALMVAASNIPPEIMSRSRADDLHNRERGVLVGKRAKPMTLPVDFASLHAELVPILNNLGITHVYRVELSRTLLGRDANGKMLLSSDFHIIIRGINVNTAHAYTPINERP